jgi:hypothetical protein
MRTRAGAGVTPRVTAGNLSRHLEPHAETLKDPGEQQWLRQIGRDHAAATAAVTPIADTA